MKSFRTKSIEKLQISLCNTRDHIQPASCPDAVRDCDILSLGSQSTSDCHSRGNGEGWISLKTVNCITAL